MHHDMHDMKPDVTRPQLAVVGLLTVLALIASVVIPAMFVNLTYSAEEVGGAIMPPGMEDTVNVGRGERYDVIWEARREGKWLLHCHIPHHTTNDNTEQEGGGGLTMVINVTE